MLLAIYPRTAWGPAAERSAASMRRSPVLLAEGRMGTTQAASRVLVPSVSSRITRAASVTRTTTDTASTRVLTVKAYPA